MGFRGQDGIWKRRGSGIEGLERGRPRGNGKVPPPGCAGQQDPPGGWVCSVSLALQGSQGREAVDWESHIYSLPTPCEACGPGVKRNEESGPTWVGPDPALSGEDTWPGPL